MVNVFPPTGKEGETSRKHGAAVLGLIASHVYSRSAIIQMRVQIQLHRDACTNTVAHMGQFLQGGKNGRLMSFFFLKVEPPCDQT